MGKKRDGKKQKKVVLSLAEFNEDAGVGGVDPELAALPSAPKAAEEWEAVGGRPEYNSRGYKERTPRNRDYDRDVDFEDRDWTRRGPLDNAEGNGFGMGPERDWSDMRRGPLDAPNDQTERDWGGMRRGPVESSFGQGGGAERDWSMRRGPVEAEGTQGGRVISDESWGVRKGPIEAEFGNSQQKAERERDWSVRKGPVEAEGREVKAEETDWGAVRRGPVEAEASDMNAAERDWSMRKGPVEAQPPQGRGREGEFNWGEARKGPVEAEVPAGKPESGSDRDWSARRGPVETEMESIEKGVRDVDFGEMRRGAKLEQLQEAEKVKEAEKQKKAEMDKDRWRRDAGGVEGRSNGKPFGNRPASMGHDSGQQKERDWGAARRSQPATHARFAENKELEGDAVETAGGDGEPEEDNDWTTVRSGSQRRSVAAMNRRSNNRDNRGSFQRRSGRRDSRGDKTEHSQLNTDNKTSTSPVSPVHASAVPDS